MRVAVIGGGTMGSGIAEVCARAGVDVTLAEVSLDAAERAKRRIAANLGRAVRKGRLEQDDADAALGRIAPSGSLEDIVGSGAAIEAIVEDEDIKRKMFRRLDALLPDAAFLASNTSSVPIMKLASATEHPERVIGLHFFNPVPVLNLVEIIRTLATSDDVYHAVTSFAEDTLGKQSIAAQDRAGFVVNALLIPYLLSAIRMLDSGFAQREDIDSGMVQGCAHPMGPLALSDLIGLDTVLAIANSIYEEFRDPAAVPPALLKRMVEAGRLGRKSGHGFYEYERAS